MLKQPERAIAIKSEQLPQLLASLRLNPYEMTAAVYGLFREIKLRGALTPGQDNAIHITKEKLVQMAKDDSIHAKLYSLYVKITRSKSWEALFEKESKKGDLSAPGLWHNPNAVSPLLPQGIEAEEEIEIVDFIKFMSAAGLDPQLVKKAFEEMMLLAGGNN